MVSFWMYERDHVTATARTRLFVDQGRTLFFEFGEFAGKVVDLISDVVKSLTVSLDKARNGAVGRRRGEELEKAIAEREHRFLDSLVLDALTVCHLETPDLFVVADRVIEICYRERDVFDPRKH